MFAKNYCDFDACPSFHESGIILNALSYVKLFGVYMDRGINFRDYIFLAFATRPGERFGCIDTSVIIFNVKTKLVS